MSSKGGDITYLCPPSPEVAEDNLVKYEINEVPGAEIHPSRRWNIVGANKDQRPVDLADEFRFRPPEDKVCDRRQDEAYPEKV